MALVRVRKESDRWSGFELQRSHFKGTLTDTLLYHIWQFLERVTLHVTHISSLKRTNPSPFLSTQQLRLCLTQRADVMHFLLTALYNNPPDMISNAPKYDSRGKSTQSSPKTLKETNYYLRAHSYVFTTHFKRKEKNERFSYWFDDCKFPFMLFTPLVHTSRNERKKRSFALRFMFTFVDSNEIHNRNS